MKWGSTLSAKASIVGILELTFRAFHHPLSFIIFSAVVNTLKKLSTFTLYFFSLNRSGLFQAELYCHFIGIICLFTNVKSQKARLESPEFAVKQILTKI
jgi:hypothetical protein